MNLSIWNEKDETHGWQVAGRIDISLATISARTGGAICFGFLDDQDRYDCLQFGFFIEADKLVDPAYLREFSIFDVYQADGKAATATIDQS